MMDLEKNIRLALKQVMDPEIGINIIDLGLVYTIDVKEQTEEGHPVVVTMTMTSPVCPLADFIVAEVKKETESVPGVAKATVNITFEPPWEPSMMSEEALLDTGMFGMI
jgi:metal-sulfur cluster biosynthetic enzyme